MTGIASLVGAVLIPVAAAACVTAADLAGGIRIDKDTGVVETYRTLRPGVVGLLVEFDAHSGSKVELAYGVYSLGFTDIVEGKLDPATRTRFEYDLAPADMPLPVAGGRWQAESFVIDGGSRRTETVTASWRGQEQMTVDGCDYEAITGTIRYAGADYTAEEGLIYLPELGISTLSYYSDDKSNDAPLRERITRITAEGAE